MFYSNGMQPSEAGQGGHLMCFDARWFTDETTDSQFYAAHGQE